LKRVCLPGLILLSALLLAGCASRPANFKELARGAAANENVVKLGIDPTRATLVVVDRQRKIFFKNEYVGTLDNPGPLAEKVRQAVEQERAAAKGGEAAAHASVVFFCAPADFKYGDVAGVRDLIKETGGNPVGITGCDSTR